MAEPTTTAVIALTAGGLALFGVVTGLHPALLLAGMAGGWWALSYCEPVSLLNRITSVCVASIVAAWGTPAALAVIDYLTTPHALNHDLLQFPIAMTIGRVTHTVSAALDSMVRRKMGEV